MKKCIRSLSLVFLLCPLVRGGEGGPSADLAARFVDPPRDARILQIIHNFPEAPEARAALIESLGKRGFGGIVANVNFREYLRSEKRWEEFRSGVEAARAAGFTVWLYDEEGYPSGAAGGLTLEGHPEWEARGLYCVSADSRDGAVEIALPPGSIIFLRAYPVRDGKVLLSEGVDLRDQVKGEDRRLRWERPGTWRAFGFVEGRLYDGTHAEMNLHRKRPYPNLLEAGAMERFIDLTHGAYGKRFQPLSASFEAIFTDEPSLLSVFIREGPYPAIPWASGLAEEFKAAKGYDLIPLLPALAADAGPEGKKVRCDFWSFVGGKLSANYFGRIQDWCRAHGIASSGHLLAEEDLGSHVGFYGNFYACASRLDYPGIDCLTSDPATVPWHVAKLLGSIACIRGAPKAMSETSDFSQRYRPPGDARPPRNVSREEILGTAYLLYSAGINVTTSYYSWAGLSDGDVRAVNEGIGRAGAILQGAKHSCDIALLYPAESAWASFVPQRLWASGQGVSRIDRIYRDACAALWRGRRDFDIVDSAAIESAAAGDGALRIGSERYRILVLPAVDVLPLAALRKAAELVRHGGAAVALADMPLNTPGEFPSIEASRNAEELFGPEALKGSRDEGRLLVRRHPSGGAGIYLPEKNGWLLPHALKKILEPDLWASRGSTVRYSRWKKRGRDFYFVVNDSGRACSGSIFLRGEGPAEIWDPASGKIVKAEAGTGGGFEISLPPYGAAFLSFANVREPRPAAKAVLDGLIEAVPLAEGAKARPEFFLGTAPHVKATSLSRDGGAPLPVRITARIEKGGVDSWCFSELRFPGPTDFSRFAALEARTRVPEGQGGTGAQLTLILIEEGKDGAIRDYLAGGRRSLGEPGLGSSAISFDSFQLAGWSKDPDGSLDLDRIRAIRIGWGGYNGREGEEISFELEGIDLLRVD